MLTRLQIADFRCIENAELELDPRCTLIIGPNGSGKTSLLEAAHVLSCGRSFRTPRADQLVRTGASKFTSVGWVDAGNRQTVLGVSGSKAKGGGLEAHVGGARVRGFAELAEALPLQVIDPNVHRLLEDGPELRRRFLDRGLFHVEPTYLNAWRRYQRALKQRNQALRANQAAAAIRVWDPELVESGAEIALARDRYIDELRGRLQPIIGGLLDVAAGLSIKNGWGEGELGDALERAWIRDQQMGSTTVGPHRADLVVTVADRAAQHHVSRGQQKLLAAGLILAQLACLAERQPWPACLLLDDPAAELDVDNLARLLTQVEHTRAQLVMTSLDGKFLIDRFPSRMFHVKQGRVSRLI